MESNAVTFIHDVYRPKLLDCLSEEDVCRPVALSCRFALDVHSMRKDSGKRPLTQQKEKLE